MAATRSATNARKSGHAALSRHSPNLYCMLGITPCHAHARHAQSRGGCLSKPPYFSPRRVRDKESDLIQLEPRGIIQISFRDRRVVLKPKFGVADVFRRIGN